MKRMRSQPAAKWPADAGQDAQDDPFGMPERGWRRSLHVVIFGTDTKAGRAFDLALIWVILASVVVVMLDSFASLNARYGAIFTVFEWIFTLLFTAEYIARLLCVRRPARYARSPFGLIDLIALIPTWIALFVPGLGALIDVRLLRLLRLFRILRLAAYIEEYTALGHALNASRRKIFVFLSFVMLVVTVMGTLMYVVEGPDNGYTNVPVSIYWAISTMTTVGFGDIAPKTGMGRFIASVMMLVGWGTLAVPTGIVSAEFTAMLAHSRNRRPQAARADSPFKGGTGCTACNAQGHRTDAMYCWSCGGPLGDAVLEK